MSVSQDLTCSFTILPVRDKRHLLQVLLLLLTLFLLLLMLLFWFLLLLLLLLLLQFLFFIEVDILKLYTLPDRYMYLHHFLFFFLSFIYLFIYSFIYWKINARETIKMVTVVLFN